ncbi:MAG: GNAT family N-acetyltransferase [Candidatus Heimdallarchaeota archaeon]|nr:GNAT family N-acetyltransferase [Candidatus Heimdallarchaeota archaeon]
MMLFEFPKERFTELKTLFEKHQHLTIVIKNTLRDRNGDVYVDNTKTPSIALMSFKIMEFIAGDHLHPQAIEAISCISENRLVLFQDDNWLKLAEKHLILSAYPRVKFSSNNLSLEKINKLLEKELPNGFTLEKIDINTLKTMNPKLLPVILPFFKSAEDFIERGIGYCIKKDDLVISLGISGFPIIDNTFIFQVITDPDPKYRRKGFATMCCAATIKESLENGIIPQFDADTDISSRLALKLGFSSPENYLAYICSKNPLKCHFKKVKFK